MHVNWNNTLFTILHLTLNRKLLNTKSVWGVLQEMARKENVNVSILFRLRQWWSVKNISKCNLSIFVDTWYRTLWPELNLVTNKMKPSKRNDFFSYFNIILHARKNVIACLFSIKYRNTHLVITLIYIVHEAWFSKFLQYLRL